jgi:SAM-dependent methyltransferase
MNAVQRYRDTKFDELAALGTVHDVGGGAKPQDRKRFRKYVLIDVNAEYAPDVVADVQALPFDDESLGAILCLDVLEHVPDPFKAVSELHRVMRPGGKMLASVPFIWPYHANPPLYGDYWRFTPDGLRNLFRGFNKVEIVKKGGWCSAMVNFVPSRRGLARPLRALAAWLDERGIVPSRSTAPSHFIFVVK